MFAPEPVSWTTRLRRAAALVKAFALLEDPPSRAPAPTAPTAGGPAARISADLAPHVVHAHAQRTHPHRLPLAGRPVPRRPGSVPARPAPCTMPLPRGAEKARSTHADR
jgi:hypothetical protein